MNKVNSWTFFFETERFPYLQKFSVEWFFVLCLPFSVFIHRLYHGDDDTVCKQIFVKLDFVFYKGKWYPYSQPIYTYILMLHQSDINLISFSLKCSLSLLLFYLNIGHTFVVYATWKRLSFKQNPSSSSILFYMPFQALREIPAKQQKFFFVFLLSMNAFTVALDRHFHFHFEIFCFAFFFYCFFPSFYFDFCTVLCNIEINNKQGITFNTRQKLVCIQKRNENKSKHITFTSTMCM